MMRAASYRRTGQADEVLTVGAQPRPDPAPGEVLVRIHASGINPADVKRRAGWNGAGMSHPLVIPHCDGAGVIEAVGEGVDPSRKGASVWLWNAQGGYGSDGRAFGTAAEYVALPEHQAVDLPDALDFAAGACLGVPAMTAWWALQGGPARARQRILVQGAAGAVGLCAVQIALACGAEVIGTVSNDAAAAHVRAMADIPLIDRKTEDVAARVRDWTGGAGVDRIIEVDLAANMACDAACLAQHGTIASYSCSSDPMPPLRYYDFANLGAHLHFVQGFSIPPQDRARGQTALAALAQAGQLALPIGAEFDLSDIAQAHKRVESGGLGNTVVRL